MEEFGTKMLFIGYHGRKGAKSDPTIMGSTVKHTIYNTRIPLCIVKSLYSRKNNATKGFTFLVCLDGSDKARRGLDIAYRSMTNANDRIIACTVSNYDTSDKISSIKKDTNQFFSDNNIQGDFKELQAKERLMNEVIDYVNTNTVYSIDFVVFGNNGLRAQEEGKVFIGTAAESLISGVIANLILVP